MFQLESIAKKHYTALPYHNFTHALAVRKSARKFIRRCQKYKIPVDKNVVEIATLFHDAGYAEVKKNKEEHSCQLMARELKKLNYQDKTITKIKQTIMATKKDGPLKTVEQKILRAADLSSFTNTYKKFLTNSQKIQREYTLLYKKSDFPIKLWTELVLSYLKPEIKLTPEYKKDDFHHKAKRNIVKLLKSLK